MTTVSKPGGLWLSGYADDILKDAVDVATARHNTLGRCDGFSINPLTGDVSFTMPDDLDDGYFSFIVEQLREVGAPFGLSIVDMPEGQNLAVVFATKGTADAYLKPITQAYDVVADLQGKGPDERAQKIDRED